MTKLLNVLALSGVVAFTAVATPTPADARCRGCGIAAGIVAGAVIAGAVAGPRYYGPDYYAYEPTSRKFVHDDFLSNLSTPSFDKTKKQLMTSSNGSVSDWEKDVYQFENGKYTLIHREVSTWDRDQHKVNVSTYELRDGQMTVVDSTSEPE